MTQRCPQCKGTGGLYKVIKPIHNQSAPKNEHIHYVTCMQTGCVNGVIDRNAYYASWGIK